MSMLNSPFPLLSDLPEVETGDIRDPKRVSIYRQARDEGYRHGEEAGHKKGYEVGVEQGYPTGYQQGYSEGLETGLKAAEQQADTRAYEMAAVLGQAIDAFHHRETVALQDIESNVVELALSLAATILDREIDAAINPGADAISRALKLAPERGELTVRMNPTDCETLGDLSLGAPGRDLVLVPDPSIEVGGVLVETDTAVIDARISTALARAREVLADPNHEAVNGLAKTEETVLS